MDRKGAFALIQDAITKEAPKETAYVNRNDYKIAAEKFEREQKGVFVAALFIAEEVLNDFKRIADAMAETAKPILGEAVEVKSQPQIIYAGPLHFRIVGNVAETFDPYQDHQTGSLFDK